MKYTKSLPHLGCTQVFPRLDVCSQKLWWLDHRLHFAEVTARKLIDHLPAQRIECFPRQCFSYKVARGAKCKYLDFKIMGLLGKVDKYLHILSHSMIRFTRLLCGKSICKNMRDHKPALILEKKEILSSPRVCFVSLKFCQPTIKRLITKTTLRHKYKLSGSQFD